MRVPPFFRGIEGELAAFLDYRSRCVYTVAKKVERALLPHPATNLDNFSNADDSATCAIDPLNLRRHLAGRDNVLRCADATRLIEF